MGAAHAQAAHSARPRWELADVLRLYGDQYCREHRVPPSHRKVMQAIQLCRTAHLGGHMEQCDRCGFQRPAYNSCRNRHCPKCQALAKARWLQARRAELLPVGYFHTVFTLPHELGPLALYNKKVVYDILFRSASETLCEFAADPRHGLAGKIGFTAVLHTWDQQLRHHVHLHCLVAGGALSADKSRWTPARQGFLFPVKALSKVFRGKFIAYLEDAFRRGKLQPGGKGASSSSQAAFAQLLARLRAKPWVVYSKKPFAGPEAVLDYLGRYTHRVAISNDRILHVGQGKVCFSYRDRAHGNRRRAATVDAGEFIRRFLLHVLPDSYVRIRHFGLLASRSKGRDLARCRQLLGQPPPPATEPDMSTRELMIQLTGSDPAACPCCHCGTMRPVYELPPFYRQASLPPLPAPPDTS
jgi:hypothetical protein